MSQAKHAWYSQKQYEAIKGHVNYMSDNTPVVLSGGNIYARADGSGVLVTQVANRIEDAPRFDDTEYLGEVVAWVRHA